MEERRAQIAEENEEKERLHNLEIARRKKKKTEEAAELEAHHSTEASKSGFEAGGGGHESYAGDITERKVLF